LVADAAASGVASVTGAVLEVDSEVEEVSAAGVASATEAGSAEAVEGLGATEVGLVAAATAGTVVTVAVMVVAIGVGLAEAVVMAAIAVMVVIVVTVAVVKESATVGVASKIIKELVCRPRVRMVPAGMVMASSAIGMMAGGKEAGDSEEARRRSGCGTEATIGMHFPFFILLYFRCCSTWIARLLFPHVRYCILSCLLMMTSGRIPLLHETENINIGPVGRHLLPC